MADRFDTLIQLMARLRAPDGCPWDRKQTHASLKPYLLEETYEVLEAIDHSDVKKLREELGDVLLQILFHAQIASETGAFTIHEVLELLADKLIRRHPHVFAKADGADDTLSPDQVYAKWEHIKRTERKASGRPESALAGVPNTLPALLRAFQVQARASRVGFDWPHTSEGTAQVLAKIEEELGELQDAVRRSETLPAPAIEAEFGDLFFALVNLSRFLKVNPEDALRGATNRFVDRFRHMEAAAIKAGRTLDTMTLQELDGLWDDAKAKQAAKASGQEAH
jgi:tetrapyrrole methylase family protein/MazG family protein